MKPKKKPKKQYAIIDGMIATIHHGRRIVVRYTSGQPLVGKLATGRAEML